MSFHLVVGHGPAGAATARLLAERGHEVRVVTRNGGRSHGSVEHVALDARDADALTGAARGAVAIHGCAAPPLTQWGTQWPALTQALCTAAEASGAVLVMLGNLYGYGPVTGPITEDLPPAATGVKGRARAAGWQHALALHEAGRIRAVEVRASDFFGPGVTTGGHLAARVIPELLKGNRSVTALGDPHAPHSWTYLPDVARTLVETAGHEQAWGRAWHTPTAPATSLRTMLDLLTTETATTPVTVRRLPRAVLATAGLFSPLLRELREVRYQFDSPFIMDSSAYETTFGARATPLNEQITTTVTWWRTHLNQPNPKPKP
ncbi:NAD-dependent epimerase/dehydratase family protein [Kitasatospora sp. NPDC094028]